MKTALFAAALMACAAMPALADTTVHPDPPHTSASFSVKHLTLTTVSGTIGIKSATLVLGADNTIVSAEATLDLTTIDTHEPDRDADLRSDHWFNVAADPLMTFKSTKVERAAGGAMSVEGNLAFHGVTRPVTLAVKYEGSVKDDRGRTHLGYSATATIDRTDWNLGPMFPPVIVGNEVTIALQLEAIEG